MLVSRFACSAFASICLLVVSSADLSAQSRPFTTDTPLGSKALARSSYSPLSGAAQITSLYQRALGRKAAPYETATWLKDSKPGLQSDALAAVLLSTEFIQRVGNDNVQFVDSVYRAVVRRAPVASERQFQIARLSSGATQRRDLVHDVIFSCEHAGLLAQEAYSLLLGRNAPAGSGMVWCPGLQARQLDVLWLDLLSSDEYYYRNGVSARGFAAALYRDLLWRDAGEAEVANISRLLVTNQMTRRQIARVFLDSGEFSAYWTLICPGQWADTTGHLASDSALNACIAAPRISKLELPAGVYRVSSGISVNKSDFTLTTENLYGGSVICEKDFPACARFVAADGSLYKQPILQVLPDISRVTIDHIIIDGNRERRSDVTALCASGAADARNVVIMNGSDNAFQFSASVNTACKTALAVGTGGTDAKPAKRVKIVHNYLHNNGASFYQVHGQWSDGMTISFAVDSVVAYNYISDSTDVALIIGNSPRTTVMWNVIEQKNKYAFVGIMDTNWNTFEPVKNWGDSRGLTIYKNQVACFDKCDVGIQAGLADMSTSSYSDRGNLRVMGGWYEQNNIVCSKQGINVDLAGTPDYPVTLISNFVYRLGFGQIREETPIGFRSLPYSGSWGTRTTSAMNISRPGDHSFVSTGAEAPVLSYLPWS